MEESEKLQEIIEKVEKKDVLERPEFKDFKGEPGLKDFYFLYEKILDKGRKGRNPSFAGFDGEMALRMSFYINYQLKRRHIGVDGEMRTLLKVANEAGYGEAIKGNKVARKEYEEICGCLESGGVKKGKKKSYWSGYLPQKR